jgi:hypothetical protein
MPCLVIVKGFQRSCCCCHHGGEQSGQDKQAIAAQRVFCPAEALLFLSLEAVSISAVKMLWISPVLPGFQGDRKVTAHKNDSEQRA